MKRLFALLAVVVFALAFVACGGSTETESTTPVEESATTDTGDTGMETTGTEDTGMTETGTEDTGVEGDTGMDEGMGEGEEAPVE